VGLRSGAKAWAEPGSKAVGGAKGLQLSACLELLFADLTRELDMRVADARRAGFGEVEIWGWRDKDLAALEMALARHGVRLRSMTVDPMVSLVDPAQRGAFASALADSIKAAQRLGCTMLVTTGGDAVPGVDRATQLREMVTGLVGAAPVLEREGIVLAIENLNSRVDHSGTILDRTADALAVVDEVGSPAVRLLYDLYHSVVMGESPIVVLKGRLDRVCHLQVADVPGRHEPGSGTIDWPGILGWLWSAGYRGSLGLEYLPIRPSAESVSYIRSVTAEIRREQG
jgi:hydroxypyruvate isomerase